MNQMEKLVTKYLHRHTSLQISGNCNTIYCALDEYRRQDRGNLQTCSLCCKALPTVDERLRARVVRLVHVRPCHAVLDDAVVVVLRRGEGQVRRAEQRVIVLRCAELHGTIYEARQQDSRFKMGP